MLKSLSIPARKHPMLSLQASKALLLVLSAGIEPASQPSEGYILSIERREVIG